MPKARLQRKIDVQPTVKSGGAPGSSALAVDIAPPAPPSILAPDNLALATSIGSSTAAPTAIISATWDAPPGVMPQGYVVQASTSSSFLAASTTTYNTIVRSIAIESLRPGTLYYVRVAARVQGYQGDWSDTASITTATDTVAAGVPTSITATWIGAGDLLVTWTNPTEANFKDVQIVIRASSGGTSYRTTYTSAGRFLYTLAMNYADTGGAGDSSLYVELKSRTFSNVLGTMVNTGLVTKSVPTTPSGLSHSWSGDAGTAGADWTITWTRAEDAYRYRLAIDSTNRQLSGNADTYTYTFALNVSEHSGTADPVLSYSLVAVDGFGQVSTAATGTATNAAPATTAVTLTAGFSVLAVTITASTAADLDAYVIRVIKDGSTLVTYTSVSPDVIFKATARGTYQVGVKVRDVFGSLSSETLSGSVVLDALTIDELRADALYTDSISTDFTSAPNKTVLRDDATGAGITYTASASAWRWTQVERPLTERFRRISVKLGSGSANFYVGVSSDGSSWTWYAGVGGDGYTLTARADEATAQTNAALFSAATNGWVELPSTVEGRYVRLGHRNTTTSYRLDEFYGYTIVIADMIRAGDIQAIHIAAGTITADKINAAFTITGKNIQTATSGARVVLSGDTNGGLVGYGSSDTYNTSTGSGTYQILWKKTDGKFYAGGGAVVLDSTGISTGISTSVDDARAYKFTNAGNVSGGLYGFVSGGIHETSVRALSIAGSDSQVDIIASSSSSDNSKIILQATSGGSSNTISMDAGNDTVTITADVTMQQTLQVDSNITTNGVLQPGNVAVSYTANTAFSLTNNGVAPIGMSNNGFAFLHAGGNGVAIYVINGGLHTTSEAFDSAGTFTPTATTAGSINVYWSGANSRYEIENKRGSTINVRMWLLDAA